MTQSRREYWRAYARRRYQERKAKAVAAAAAASTDDHLALGPQETIKALYKRLCRERGLGGQANWRARAKLKREIHASLGLYSPPNQRAFATKLLARARAGAKASNRAFDLTEDDLIPLPALCPVLNVGLDYGGLLCGVTAYTPSIDRIDSAGDYTPDNIQVISWRANRLKNDATLQELEALGRWASQQRKSCTPPPPLL